MGCSVKTGSFGNGGGGGSGKSVFSKTGVTPINDNILYILSEEEFNKIFKNDKTYIVAISLDKFNVSGGLYGETYIFGAAQYDYEMILSFFGGYNASNENPRVFTQNSYVRNVGAAPSYSGTWNTTNTYSIEIIECAAY